MQQTDQHPLPTRTQLVKSTVLAFATAMVIFITVVLPAEYAKDPSGLGELLGLMDMGRIKVQLAQEADAMRLVLPKVALKAPLIAAPKAENATPEAQDHRQLTLKPGQAAEIKVSLKKDQIVNYQWSVNQGHVNFDNHGDNPNINYHGYKKGKKAQQDNGIITAAFDGNHGWFWRNRSDKPLTLILTISGGYSDIVRLL